MAQWLNVALPGWQIPYTLGMVALIFSLLMATRWAPDIVMLFGLALLILSGVIPIEQGLKGFANPGMITVAILFIVGAAVRETGAIDWILSKLLGRPRTIRGAIARMLLPTTTLSAFLNNTPLVAMLIPVLGDWCKQQKISPSKLMIPLSYGAILGGVCTLIGTSTNLVVDGLLRQEKGVELGMFDITWVGLPILVVGCIYLLIVSPWLLPDRKPPISSHDDPREYTVEMLVPAESALIGQTIEGAGLRHLPGMYLVEIDRDGLVIVAVSPEEKLRSGDRLVFVGVVDGVVDLQRMRGLVPATDQVFKLDAPRSTRCLVEAVVSDTCPLEGQTIRAGRFRSVYNAAVLAVARNGERLRQKIGDIQLRAGDTLLLECQASFVEEQRNRRDFFLVSRLEGYHLPDHSKAPLALAILTGMVLLAGFEQYSGFDMLRAALVAAILMIATRCVTVAAARRSIDWSTLLAIAASFGIGEALKSTGAAEMIAHQVSGFVAGSPLGSLAIVYIITLVTTELISNNAAAALMFPFALSTAETLGVSYMPFVLAVMVAASSSFATPIGYQTHLMVYGPGGYRFNDYVRIGVPLDLLIFAVTMVVLPRVWPF